ncbi:MAG TPA: DUF294 nucleotidyltransferase-like domain-containing protein [Candidatus Aquicultor sp.]
MVTNEVVEFLGQVAPFKFLDTKVLRAAAKKVLMEFYPKGSLILAQSDPSPYLYVIKKGGVKVFIKSGSEEVIVDYRSEGDSFGFISLYSGERSRTNIVAIDDTICYLIDKETFNKLKDANPAFAEFFLESYLNKYSGRAFVEMYQKDIICRAGMSSHPAVTVGDIVSRKTITAPPEISIQAAARTMSEYNISSLVVVNNDGYPVGIVTDRDLRDKVIAKGKDMRQPVGDVMSTDLRTVQAKDYSFEALLKMIRHNIHHLLVMDGEKLKGMLTNHDLMMLSGTSPVTIAREIESVESIDELYVMNCEINQLVTMLIKEGTHASDIARIISELNDRLVKKVIEIELKELGKPPVPFCWVVFGSEGRKEQTCKTDQDNALIYADPASKEQEVEVMYYFAELSRRVNDGLIKSGFPPCPANYMASNPKWCQPLHVWKRYFTDWITSAIPEALLLSTIFFDFRPVDGDFDLAEELRAHLTHTLGKENFFLTQMSSMIGSTRPPLGFFKSFVVEKSGEHKNHLNLKTSGLALLVDIIRLFSLEKGVKETATLDRIIALQGRHEMLDEYSHELKESFEFLMLLRLVHQYEQCRLGEEIDNFIDPNKLSLIEKQTLKEVFYLISKLQDQIEQRYRLGAVSR